MSGSEHPIYRIICRRDKDYSVACRGGNVVFALTNPYDRYQHWIKDESHGAKDTEGQPAFALINRATGEAIKHCHISTPVPVVQYNPNSWDKSVLWSMSKPMSNEFGNMRRVDNISVVWAASYHLVYDGHIIDLCVPKGDPDNDSFLWEIRKVIPSPCISLFRPSQHTIKISYQRKKGYNLAIDKDGSTVMLVPSNPKDKYQHWIKETPNGVPIKDTEGQEAFALVNKATGKAIKQGFGNKYLVQVARLYRNYIDPSLLWTESNGSNGFNQIRSQHDIYLAFDIFDDGVGMFPLLGLSKNENAAKEWKIEDF